MTRIVLPKVDPLLDPAVVNVEGTQGPLAEAYKRLQAMETAMNIDVHTAPPEVGLAANQALADFSENARADMNTLFLGLFEVIEQKDRFKFALSEMVEAYGGYVPADDPLVVQNPAVPVNDLYEVRVFRAFLKATGILGIRMNPGSSKVRRAEMMSDMLQREIGV